MPEESDVPNPDEKPTTPNPNESAKGNDPAKTEEPKFTQADLDRIVKDRLEREKAKATEAAEKARKEAEEKALADNAQFKELSERYAAENTTLKERVKYVEDLEASLTAFYESEKKGVPGYVLEILEEKPIHERLAYITKHKSEWEETEPRTGGGRITPTPSGGGGREPKSEERTAGMVRAWRGM